MFKKVLWIVLISFVIVGCSAKPVVKSEPTGEIIFSADHIVSMNPQTMAWSANVENGVVSQISLKTDLPGLKYVRFAGAVGEDKLVILASEISTDYGYGDMWKLIYDREKGYDQPFSANKMDSQFDFNSISFPMSTFASSPIFVPTSKYDNGFEYAGAYRVTQDGEDEFTEFGQRRNNDDDYWTVSPNGKLVALLTTFSTGAFEKNGGYFGTSMRMLQMVDGKEVLFETTTKNNDDNLWFYGWSADSRYGLFYSYDATGAGTGCMSIVDIHSNTPKEKLLYCKTQTPEDHTWPVFSSATWSPDGGKIVFQEGYFAIVVCSLWGDCGKVFKDGIHTGFQWSPDSAWIAFVLDEKFSSKTPGIYAIRSDGSDLRMIVNLTPPEDGERSVPVIYAWLP
ncbi:MAG TPA: hypothetical protein VLH94_01620 [Spirochaetia bacterium]|nr:hypothetical protein [Spirochaetia bacterium]